MSTEVYNFANILNGSQNVGALKMRLRKIILFFIHSPDVWGNALLLKEKQSLKTCSFILIVYWIQISM